MHSNAKLSRLTIKLPVFSGASWIGTPFRSSGHRHLSGKFGWIDASDLLFLGSGANRSIPKPAMSCSFKLRVEFIEHLWFPFGNSTTLSQKAIIFCQVSNLMRWPPHGQLRCHSWASASDVHQILKNWDLTDLRCTQCDCWTSRAVANKHGWLECPFGDNNRVWKKDTRSIWSWNGGTWSWSPLISTWQDMARF